MVAPKRKRNAEKPKVAFGSSAATTNTNTPQPAARASPKARTPKAAAKAPQPPEAAASPGPGAGGHNRLPGTVRQVRSSLIEPALTLELGTRASSPASPFTCSLTLSLSAPHQRLEVEFKTNAYAAGERGEQIAARAGITYNQVLTKLVETINNAFEKPLWARTANCLRIRLLALFRHALIPLLPQVKVWFSNKRQRVKNGK